MTTIHQRTVHIWLNSRTIGFFMNFGLSYQDRSDKSNSKTRKPYFEAKVPWTGERIHKS